MKQKWGEKMQEMKKRSPAWRELIGKMEIAQIKWAKKWESFSYQVELGIFYGSYFFKW